VDRSDPAWGEAYGKTSLDTIADAWARERGVELPDPDRGRSFLADGFVPSERGRALVRNREDAHLMRDYLSALETRLESNDWDQVEDLFEHRRIRLQAEILRLRYREGLQMREIARVLKRQSGSWTSYQLRLIRAEAYGRAPTPVKACLREPSIHVVKRTWRAPRRFDALVELVSKASRVSVQEALRLTSLRGMLGLASSLLQLERWASKRGLCMPIEIEEEHDGRWRFLRWNPGIPSRGRLHPHCTRILEVLADEGPLTAGRLMGLLGISKHDSLGRRLFDLRSAAPIMGLPRWIMTIRGHRAYFSLEKRQGNQPISAFRHAA